jgi:hypothetical protein
MKRAQTWPLKKENKGERRESFYSGRQFSVKQRYATIQCSATKPIREKLREDGQVRPKRVAVYVREFVCSFKLH